MSVTFICNSCSELFDSDSYSLERGLCTGCDRPDITTSMFGSRLVMGWDDIRATRNRLLSGSDWTQLPDVPEATQALWRPYRAALRAITETYENPEDVIWPDPPTG